MHRTFETVEVEQTAGLVTISGVIFLYKICAYHQIQLCVISYQLHMLLLDVKLHRQ